MDKHETQTSTTQMKTRLDKQLQVVINKLTVDEVCLQWYSITVTPQDVGDMTIIKIIQ